MPAKYRFNNMLVFIAVLFFQPIDGTVFISQYNLKRHAKGYLVKAIKAILRHVLSCFGN